MRTAGLRVSREGGHAQSRTNAQVWGEGMERTDAMRATLEDLSRCSRDLSRRAWGCVTAFSTRKTKSPRSFSLLSTWNVKSLSPREFSAVW
eukprot:3584632-Rhodomonas_salina.1